MLLLAMLQASNPTQAPLNGQLAFILLLAIALVLPISFGLIRFYRRAVSKSMGSRASSVTNEAMPLATATSPHQPPPSPELRVVDAPARVPTGTGVAALCAEVLHAPWRTAAVYIVAGACYAAILSVAYLVADQLEISPLRFLYLFWILSWPMVLTVNLVAAATRRAKFAILVVYFLILASIHTVSLAFSPEAVWYSFIPAWAIYNLPTTLLLLTFLNRRVRAVGPLVLIFMIIAVLGSQVTISILGRSDWIIRGLVKVGSIIGLGGLGILIGVSLLGFFIAWPFAWLALRMISRLYERKKTSDESITIDAIWLLFAFVDSLMLSSKGSIWIFSGLLAFLGFKVVAWVGLRLLRSRTTRIQKAPRLLLLRVFSLGKRSEKLFRALATHWRHIGSIELITGLDLAKDTLEPHEFLDFLSGKLSRRFIDGPQAMERRTSEMDIKPDHDGRFRVNDFSCHADTWQMVLSRLVNESDAVLMDLRGFSSKNNGCIFEIKELINVAPLGRVVFIIDNTTAEPFLLEKVRESWNSMKPTSPNRMSALEQLQLFRLSDSRRGELPRLLRALCIAANPA